MSGQTYLRNTWYVFAWADEIGEAPLGRTIAGEPLVVFRGKEGLAALEDVCPHRFVPLSRGAVADGVLECAYHGLRFGKAGKCVLNPLGEPPEAAAVRAYPVVELHAAIWVWMGDPDKADSALIPDFAFLTDSARATVTGYTHARAEIGRASCRERVFRAV